MGEILSCQSLLRKKYINLQYLFYLLLFKINKQRQHFSEIHTLAFPNDLQWPAGEGDYRRVHVEGIKWPYLVYYVPWSA